jgi:hypothetical protein
VLIEVINRRFFTVATIGIVENMDYLSGSFLILQPDESFSHFIDMFGCPYPIAGAASG